MRRYAVLLIAAGAASSADARVVKIERDSSALEFEYQWSSEAAVIKPLNKELMAKADAAYRQALKDARADEVLAKKDKREFHPHSFGVNWETMGQSARLLSIGAAIETFTGGAHPNHNVDAQLWDRRLAKRIPVAGLFIRPDAFEKLTRSTYCKAIDKERASRRGGEKLEMFDDCPKYSDLAIGLRDRQPNGRFEAIEFTASPYTAGPYAEGEYSIVVPVTRQMMAAIKPLYRSSFEFQRQ